MRQLTKNRIARAVFHVWKTDRESVLANSRKPISTEPRAVYMSMIYQYLELTLSEVGRAVKGRNRSKPYSHCTILGAIKKVSDLRETDNDFNNKCEAVISIIETGIFPVDPSIKKNFDIIEQIFNDAVKNKIVLNALLNDSNNIYLEEITKLKKELSELATHLGLKITIINHKISIKL